MTAKITGTYTPKDRTREDEWLRHHKHEYVGQWVALDGDSLLAAGQNLTEVMAEARARQADCNPMCVLVEDPNAPPFAGF